jgi:hypothetical protein
MRQPLSVPDYTYIPRSTAYLYRYVVWYSCLWLSVVNRWLNPPTTFTDNNYAGWHWLRHVTDLSQPEQKMDDRARIR